MADYKEINGVKIWKNPPESMLNDLGVFTTWRKWGSEPASIPWTFDSGSEKMYFIKGKVKVSVEGHADGSFELEAGDLAEFPKGMTIDFNVIETMEKYFHVADH